MGEAMIRGRRTRINYAKDWEYTTNDTATLVTKYIGNKTDVVVPSKINGKPVVLKQSTARRNAYISSFDTTGAFINNKNIVSVKFSEGVEIENNNMGFMFWNCSNLKSGPIIPINVTNMINTFQDCVSFINTPTVPSNVTDMGSTFYNCFNLVNAPTIPANVTNMSSTFQGCYNIINAPNIPDSVIFLGSTFQGCNNITNAPVIPANVNTISFAFSGCTKLTGNVYIKSNRIANDRIYSCFSGTTLPKNVYIPSQGYNATANTWNAAFNTTYGINGKNGVTVIDDAVLDFEYTTNDTTALVTKYIGSKTDVVVPSTLSGKKVVLQNSATSQTGVFTNNRNIKSVKFSEGVSIANNNMDYAFYYCNRLVNTPVIPANVTDMRCTFYNCTNLVNAPEIPANITDMSRTFSDCRNLINAPVIPANVTSMYQTFSNCTNLTGNIHITSNRINNTSMKNCFNGTTLPKNVYIPSQGYNAVANTWNAAFNTTYGINGKNGVTVMDEAALDWTYTTNDTATLLTKYTGDKADVVVPAALAAKPTMLSTAVFKGTSVNSVDLSGVNFANNNMANTFNSCTNLKDVTNLVNTVTEANDAFHGCTNLKSVDTYNNARVQFSNGVNLFRNCRNLTSAPNHSFKNATATGAFNISHAFENCSNLVTANSSMTAYIYYTKTNDGIKPVDASYMFANCTNFTSINEDFAVVRSVGWNSNYSHMFYNCRSLTNTRNTFYAIYAGWNSNCSNMYSQCVNLKSSHIAFLHPDDNTADINICGMYSGCMNLTEILGDLPRTTKMVRTFVSTKVANFPAIPNSVTNMSGAFFGCPRIVNVPTIPSNVTIMDEAFYGCRNIINAPDIPDNAVNLTYAFYDCYNLVNAPIIPSNVTDMHGMFYECYNLTGDVMIFSNKINSSGLNMVFMGADKPKNVYMYNTGYNTTANSWAAAHNASAYFNGYNGVNVINMGTWENASWTYTTSGTNTLVTKYKGTNNTVYVPSKINGRNVVLQNSANATSGVFTGNVNITDVRFGRNVGFTNNNMYSAFRGCANLISVSGIPTNTTDMSLTFDHCYNLINAPTIPDNVTGMSQTFYCCYNLINGSEIPANVTNMYLAFSCTNLINAPVIPNKVTDMESAFYNCHSLTNAPVIPVNVIDIKDVFRNCTNLVNVPNMTQAISVKNMSGAFWNCTNLVNAPAMPTNVTNMCQTFIDCINLVNAPIIPANVTNMYGTFRNCTNLTGNIKIMSNRIVNAAIANCFMNTSKTKNVYIPFTGYSATANTHNAAINATYGISGKNGVTIYDINTYKG